MHPVLRRLVSLADLCAAPLLLLGGPLLWAAARGGHRLPLCRTALDRLGVALLRRHYYSPAAPLTAPHRPFDEERPLPGIAMNEDRQLALLAALRYGAELEELPLEPPGVGRFGYHNGTFESGDAEILYSLIRRFKPRRMIEIGAGNSTLVARAAIRRNRAEDPGYTCDHLCIEPFENPWLEQCGARVLRQRVERCEPALFETLQRDDILFIDSSHVIRPQGDVVHEYLHLLGRLRPGVLIHVHDIFTPRDYLARWVLVERRLWNEQYLLEAFLSFNGQFEILAAVNWLAHNHPKAIAAACPILGREPDREPGSFWFRRVA